MEFGLDPSAGWSAIQVTNPNRVALRRPAPVLSAGRRGAAAIEEEAERQAEAIWAARRGRAERPPSRHGH